MKKFMTLRKNKKGFTLVELLVVLVIIAILMAAIIPSMMGFINKAKDESASAECRNILLAANVVLNEDYGKGAIKTGYVMNVTSVKNIAGTANAPTTVTVDFTTDAKNPKITAITGFKASNNTPYDYDGTKWVKQ